MTYCFLAGFLRRQFLLRQSYADYLFLFRRPDLCLFFPSFLFDIPAFTRIFLCRFKVMCRGSPLFLLLRKKQATLLKPPIFYICILIMSNTYVVSTNMSFLYSFCLHPPQACSPCAVFINAFCAVSSCRLYLQTGPQTYRYI